MAKNESALDDNAGKGHCQKSKQSSFSYTAIHLIRPSVTSQCEELRVDVLKNTGTTGQKNSDCSVIKGKLQN